MSNGRLLCLEASRALVDVPPVSSSTTAAEKDQGPTVSGADGVGLGAAFGQAIGFNIFQHVVRLREEKTRRELGGPFLADWFESVSHLGGNWDDGGKKVVNYVLHPMGGAVYAHIYRQNDRHRRELEVGEPGYGGMVLRALTFSAIISLQFELGPFSEASIGNVGMRDATKMAWGDLVITPALGVAWMVGEDVIDEQILRANGRPADRPAQYRAVLPQSLAQRCESLQRQVALVSRSRRRPRSSPSWRALIMSVAMTSRAVATMENTARRLAALLGPTGMRISARELPRVLRLVDGSSARQEREAQAMLLIPAIPFACRPTGRWKRGTTSRGRAALNQKGPEFVGPIHSEVRYEHDAAFHS